MEWAGDAVSEQGLGNAAQVRLIVEQTIEAYRVLDKDSSSKRTASWPAWIALGLSVAGLIFGAGVLRSDVASATHRLEKNDAKIAAIERQNSSVEKGVARIEAKVDILMEERGR